MNAFLRKKDLILEKYLFRLANARYLDLTREFSFLFMIVFFKAFYLFDYLDQLLLTILHDSLGTNNGTKKTVQKVINFLR